MLSDRELQFLAALRIAHLATADRGAIPHVVPVCYVVSGDTLYVTIDEKPKRRPVTTLKLLRNISENPVVAIVVDRYDED
jgi:PPOX class probable F420-dependent enzyme